MCKANEYFSASASNAVIESVVFLRHMARLQSNVEQQWLANGTGADNALKTYGQTELEASKANSSLLHRYSVVCKQDRAAKFTPFGLVDITEVQQNNESGSGLIADAIAANKIGCETSDTDDAIGINLGRGGKRLTCSYLVTDKQSQEYFYRMPRLRKIWWMKVTRILEIHDIAIKVAIVVVERSIKNHGAYCYLCLCSMRPTLDAF